MYNISNPFTLGEKQAAASQSGLWSLSLETSTLKDPNMNSEQGESPIQIDPPVCKLAY